MSPKQESLLFHHELGLAISYWAYVEMDLRHLVSCAVPLEARQLVSVGFFSIENFRSKLNFCDSILTERFHSSPHYPRWSKLNERVQALARKRNRLAHRTVMVYGHGKPGRRYALISWMAEQYTAPSRATKVRIGSHAPPPDAMCLREIVEAKYEFEAVMHSLRNLRSAFLGEPEPHAASLEVPMKAPTVALLWKKVASGLAEL